MMRVRVSDIRASGPAGQHVRFAPGPQWYAAAVQGADVDTTDGAIGGELTLTWAEGTILSSGRVDATLHATCSRCLERVQQAHTLDMKLVLLPKTPEPASADVATGKRRGKGSKKQELEQVVDAPVTADDDEEVSYYSGEWVEVGELVREALLLALPLYPLCREECRGLCARCGADLNAGPCSCPPVIDSPFAALKDVLERK